MNTSRTTVRFGAALAFAALALTATSAAAHVTVTSPDASPGGFGKLAFRVPTESESASTIKVKVTLPKETPFAFVSTKVKPGWKAAITMEKHASPVKVGDFTLSETASAVTWTATGTGIAPTQFDEFELSVGPFPTDRATSLEFATTQSYDDGSVANWDQPTRKGSEPDKPAPVLSLDGGASGHNATSDASSPAPQLADAAPDTLARALGGAALLVAFAGLLGVLRKNRQRA